MGGWGSADVGELVVVNIVWVGRFLVGGAREDKHTQGGRDTQQQCTQLSLPWPFFSTTDLKTASACAGQGVRGVVRMGEHDAHAGFDTPPHKCGRNCLTLRLTN